MRFIVDEVIRSLEIKMLKLRQLKQILSLEAIPSVQLPPAAGYGRGTSRHSTRLLFLGLWLEALLDSASNESFQLLIRCDNRDLLSGRAIWTQPRTEVQPYALCKMVGQ